MRKLNIFINQDKVGVLTEEHNIWSFTYDTSWLSAQHTYPLNPTLALSDETIIDGATQRPVQWFFDNLLPEEEARRLLSTDCNTTFDDTFAILAIAGEESAGAITLCLTEPPPTSNSMQLLNNDELSKRIQLLPQSPLNQSAKKRMSLAGAQHKMLVCLQDDQIYEPLAGCVSTHILKPDHSRPDQYWQTVRNEWFMMTLAKRVGLDVPEVSIQYVPEPVYLIKRFDRDKNYNRIHTLDACQLLDIPHLAKYDLSHLDSLTRVIAQCRQPVIARLTLFRWIIFNALTGNNDAHLKNISVFYDQGKTKITPFYDLVCTAIYNDRGLPIESELSQPLNGKVRFADLTREDFILAGKTLGIVEKVAKKEFDQMLSAVTEHAEQLYEEVKDSDEVNPAKNAELMMLREINFKVIKEMTTLLKS